MTRHAHGSTAIAAPGREGHRRVGMGMATSLGTVTYPAQRAITETGQKHAIDGLTFEFMLTPDTEAPAEMHLNIQELGASPQRRTAPHAPQHLHVSGCPDPRPADWSHYLNETIERWGARAEVMYGMHHWPVWDRACPRHAEQGA